MYSYIQVKKQWQNGAHAHTKADPAYSVGPIRAPSVVSVVPGVWRVEMLLLDEEACKRLSEEKQVLCVLQWLQNLPQVIRNTSKARAERLYCSRCTEGT